MKNLKDQVVVGVARLTAKVVERDHFESRRRREHGRRAGRLGPAAALMTNLAHESPLELSRVVHHLVETGT